MHEPKAIVAEINYLGAMTTAPVSYSHNRDKGNLVLDRRRLPIHDIRDETPSLAREGFILAKLPLSNEGELEVVTERFHSLVTGFIAECSGAEYINVMSPRVRYTCPPEPDKVVSTPAPYAHCDFTPERFHSLMQMTVADHPDRDRLLAGRRAIYQSWVAISPPPQDLPLAIMDRTTLKAGDLVKGSVMVGPPDKVAPYEAFYVRYSPEHKWNYVSNMTARDVLIFVGYDSADERLPGSPHSAFPNPAPPDTLVARVSLEARAFVFWGQ